MRFLIDGYNLMHAKGLMPVQGARSPRGLLDARARFLDQLAAHLGPLRAALTTVVFDAADPPRQAAERMRHREMEVVFAVGDENADARLEALIQAHPSPRALTVISSDRRVLEAARRRRAIRMTADVFWAGGLEAPNGREVKPSDAPRETADGDWLAVFTSVDADETSKDDTAPGSLGFAPTQAEIEEIARQVGAESRIPRRKR